MARHKSDEPNAVIANWLRNRNTIEYLGIWEQLYNPDFKPTEFEGFRMQAELNAFTLSPKKWIEATNAVGIISKSGRYDGTYAHKEMLYNPDFNYTEFGTIKNAAGSNNFVLSVKTWIERTNAIGIRSKAGRYGGTYAHRDIAYLNFLAHEK